jgi:AcrR family transcriptional regulator
MARKKEQLSPDTEDKIKQAAKEVFLREGYEGATVRQIAREAGVNVALMNYYFQSKEQLFRSIYMESFGAFFGSMVRLLNEEIPLEVKIWKIVDRYTDFLMENPMIPLFVLAEHRKEGEGLFQELNVREVVQNSYFTRQLQAEADQGNIRPVNPLHVVFSLMGNLIFPIVARPVISYVGAFDEAGFRQFMEERKKIIPEMIMAYLKSR